MALSAYATEDGKPKAQPSIVVYLDVLGFTQQVRASHDTGASDTLLQRFAAVIRQWYVSLRGQAQSGDERRDWELKAFTDNVVLGHPIRWDDGEAELTAVMSDVALFQIGLAHEGFFVRGGIAAGDLYMDEDIVFGIGLLDAVEAEQKADTPRVVLAESAIQLVKQHLEYYASVDTSPQNRHLLFDEDNQFVVNYLSCSWPDHTEPPLFDWLAKHRDVLVGKLAHHRAEPHVWAKYAWVARYHNYFCDSIPGGMPHRVDVSLPPLEPKRLQDVIRKKERPNKRLHPTAEKKRTGGRG